VAKGVPAVSRAGGEEEDISLESTGARDTSLLLVKDSQAISPTEDTTCVLLTLVLLVDLLNESEEYEQALKLTETLLPFTVRKG
jgi:hypothetical protein